MQLCLFTHEFHFIERRKKIRACGHDFEEAMHAYDNWRNPRKDVTDLIGQMEALIVVKYSPRWYNIVERNRRHIGQLVVYVSRHGGILLCEKNSSLEKKDPFASFGACSRH